MLKTVRQMIRRLGFVGALLLTLVFAMPAFEAEACVPTIDPGLSAVASAQDVQAVSDDELGCRDCADCTAACMGGCCHAPHTAVIPSLDVQRPAADFARPELWTHVAGLPLGPPPGPERPPRA